MMARSPPRSNQRPDTLMQDRICQVDETSCNARPDHTCGSNSEVRARNWAVRFTLKNRHRQPGLSGPKSADSVEKLENRTPPEISRQSISKRYYCRKAPQGRYEDRWSFLQETMRSVAPSTAKRISGP
jgi:hypothetical protein